MKEGVGVREGDEEREGEGVEEGEGVRDDEGEMGTAAPLKLPFAEREYVLCVPSPVYNTACESTSCCWMSNGSVKVGDEGRPCLHNTFSPPSLHANIPWSE